MDQSGSTSFVQQTLVTPTNLKACCGELKHALNRREVAASVIARDLLGTDSIESFRVVDVKLSPFDGQAFGIVASFDPLRAYVIKPGSTIYRFGGRVIQINRPDQNNVLTIVIL